MIICQELMEKVLLNKKVCVQMSCLFCWEDKKIGQESCGIFISVQTKTFGVLFLDSNKQKKHPVLK